MLWPCQKPRVLTLSEVSTGHFGRGPFSKCFGLAKSRVFSAIFAKCGVRAEAPFGPSCWQAKLDYLHANSCRKGLVRQPEHWRFSSAGYWLNEDEMACDALLSRVYW